MTTDTGGVPLPPAPTAALLPRGALGAWWAQGMRTALLMRPRWDGLPPVTPLLLALLWAVPTAFGLLIERLMIAGAADFYAPALLGSGWIHAVVAAMACWALWHAARAPAAGGPAGPAALLAMVFAQAILLLGASALVIVPLARDGAFGPEHPLWATARMLWVLYLAWSVLAPALLMWRSHGVPAGVRVGVIVAFAALTLVADLYMPMRHWYPARVEAQEPDTAAAFRLTPEVFEAQAEALQGQLQALRPHRAGRIDVYAVTFAPDADAEVFARESAMVADVVQQRFAAEGRVVQLVNRRDPAVATAWATPRNLERTVARIAALMNRDEDVLLLHLTSHGGRDGTLAASFWPLDVESLTPVRLKAMLDAAGVKHRVISVSACYSGSWIAPLADDDTLVMTAADAQNTSYGCGRRSELTYFGRAMFDEQLRQGASFEAGHATAREVIAQREKAAGKNDGYSNPQIAMGARIRERLQRLVAQRPAAP